MWRSAAGRGQRNQPRAALNENLDKSVEELELFRPVLQLPEDANIRTIRELRAEDRRGMLKTKTYGRKSLNEIKEILSGWD